MSDYRDTPDFTPANNVYDELAGAAASPTATSRRQGRAAVDAVVGKVEGLVGRTVGEPTARKVRQKADAVIDRAEQAYSTAHARVDRELALQPYKALGIAAVAGLVVGLMLARRDRTIIYRPVDR